MEDQHEALLKDMEDTRTALSDKLEALEQKVSEKVEPIAAAVERATEAAAGIVEEVKDTFHEVKESVHDVKESVGETVHQVASAFNLRKQTERHPWVILGLATTAGCVIGNLLRRPSPNFQNLAAASSRSKQTHRGGNGRSHRASSHENGADKSEASSKEGLFTEELHRLKGLAVGALMGVIREVAKRSFPPVLGSKLAEEVDSLTTRLGVEPIKGPVLGEASECDEVGAGGQVECHEGFTAASDDRPGKEVNRMKSRRSGSGLN